MTSIKYNFTWLMMSVLLAVSLVLPVNESKRPALSTVLILDLTTNSCHE